MFLGLPDPDPLVKVTDPYPYVLGLPGPDPLVRGTDPDPASSLFLKMC
jgi:hypothetical protein